MNHKKSSSWEPVSSWYDQIVGEKGHTYHKELILPCLKKQLNFDTFENPALLDLGCGTGVLGRCIPQNIKYLGLDISPSLIKIAKNRAKSPSHQFQVADLTKPVKIAQKEPFTHAVAVLSMQNMNEPAKAIELASNNLCENGQLVIVLNHPCFRIPRQSSWGTDKEKNIQYRRLDRYMSPMDIPIQMNPSKGKKSETTLSKHAPLSLWTKWLSQNGFTITGMDELCSHKTSEGGAAKRENRARNEFPLFLVISATKKRIMF